MRVRGLLLVRARRDVITSYSIHYTKLYDIAAYAEAKGFPIIPCNLCGSQENLQRKQVKKMMDAWERETPGRVEQIARALGDIRPSQLSDPRLFDFLSLGRQSVITSYSIHYTKLYEIHETYPEGGAFVREFDRQSHRCR